MDGARIYLKGPTQSELIPMVETAYIAEHLLQEALASYPELYRLPSSGPWPRG